MQKGRLAGRARRVIARSRLPGVREGYFEHLAPTYDDWWTRTGRMVGTEANRPGWRQEVDALRVAIEGLEPARTLDVGCGTGFLTRSLRGQIVGLDASAAMLDIARRQAPEAIFVLGDALSLPFPGLSFERLFASHVYGHFHRGERRRFLREARRVAAELVIIDTTPMQGFPDGSVQLRGLSDGSRWKVFKQPFTGAQLLAELGHGEVLHEGDYFVMVRSADS